MNILTKVLNEFVIDLIHQYGKYTSDGYKLDVRELLDSDQYYFVSHLIKSDVQEKEEWSWLLEYDHQDEIANIFAKFLSKSDDVSKEQFLEAMKEASVNAYSKRMQEVIDQCCLTLEYNIMTDNDYYQHQDRHTGEYIWRARA